ncbi:hypothetical protein LOK49_LG05G01743 [Camellia lanceoleosa]|uniref:Uncharacterized protein n=1 Tax=Camellia lanceoleosa TaxID=1840588 RepID=A0ACC0HP03_9ERIC|nr:hypothetical protein LOK49_LG05G01743 [Camellia lanceoleosa]
MVGSLFLNLIQQLFDEVRQSLPQRLKTMDNNKLKAVLKEFLQESKFQRVMSLGWFQLLQQWGLWNSGLEPAKQ